MPDQHNGVLLDVAGAAAHLGVSEAFVRRLVLERRVRYFKVGKLLRFRPADLDAFIEAGRRDPVNPWVHTRSPQRRGVGRNTAQRRLEADVPGSASDQQDTSAGA
jgi:excisionase family DNA binding protein